MSRSLRALFDLLAWPYFKVSFSFRTEERKIKESKRLRLISSTGKRNSGFDSKISLHENFITETLQQLPACFPSAWLINNLASSPSYQHQLQAQPVAHISPIQSTQRRLKPQPSFECHVISSRPH